ncbi:hypothetical protein AB0H07_40540 [Streptomyces sp. NPDC021354]|uniref:hypothetical protein n=1 Tax=Streptomyces sp. NPDC021354 TaxID=3154793 RepID=UPI0033C3ABA9
MAHQKRPAGPADADDVFASLDAEWVSVCADPAIGMAVRSWMVADGLADPQTTVIGPEQVLALIRSQHGAPAEAVADALLRMLLVRAVGNGRPATWAARIVVQAMLPAALRIARGQRRDFGGRSFDDVKHITVTALWEVARSGRVHTRPGRAAANLALDTLKRTCRELARDREAAVEYLDDTIVDQVVDPRPGPAQSAEASAVLQAAADHGLEPDETLASPIEPSAARLELLQLLLDALRDGTLTGPDAQAIAWHHREIRVPDSVGARAAGTTPGAWRRRRGRAVQRLSPAAAALAAAA